MSRARIEAIALVNWQGIFYERLLFDRAVTALEGPNGAGKTTVMVAVYIALFPELGKLRFTNLGEHDARSGDRGIYGRLANSPWPAFSVLDLRVGRDERILAGVKITRKTEPSVELEPFIVTGLAASVRLRDVLLDDSTGADRLIDRPVLNTRVALAGGEITWCTAVQYFRELFERGVMPLRLASDEDRRRFNHMLRTSMIGGISHTLSGGLRDFVLREDPSLAEGLRSMKDNLAACQTTRRQIEEEERAESEVRGVYEAGSLSFAAGTHQVRVTAERREAESVQAGLIEGVAQRAFETMQTEKVGADTTLARLDNELQKARDSVQESARTAAVIADATQRVQDLETATTNAARGAERAEAAQATFVLAQDQMQAAASETRRARDQSNTLAHQLANLNEAFAHLSERAGLYRHAQLRLAELAPIIGDIPAEQGKRAERFAAAARTLTAEGKALTTEIAELRAKESDADHHGAAHARLVAALVQVETAFGAGEGEAHARAAHVLAQAPGWRSVAGQASALTAEAKRLFDQRVRQENTRSATEAVLGAPATSSTLRAAWENARESEKIATERRAEAKQEQREGAERQAQLREAQRILTNEIPSWEAASVLANELSAAFGAPIAGLTDLDHAEDQWRTAEATASNRATNHRQRSEKARREAELLEQSASGLNPKLLLVASAVAGEPLAARYNEISLDEAPVVEALLGPLREAILVPDALAAARAAALLPDAPREVHFLRVFPEDALPGSVIESGIATGNVNEARFTRLPERPILGQAARHARIESLGNEALEQETFAAQAESEALRKRRWLGDARRLRQASALWLAPSPRLRLVEVAAGLALEAERAMQTAEKYSAASVTLQHCASRTAALAALLPDASLLDDVGLPERAAACDEQARRATLLLGLLRTNGGALELLGRGIEPLRHAPLTAAERVALAKRVEVLAERRIATNHLLEAANWLAEHAEALDWGNEANQERSAEEKLAGLRQEHEQASARLAAAESREGVARSAETEARTAFVRDQGAYEQALQWCSKLEAELDALGVGRPSPGELANARRSLTVAQAAADGLARSRDEHQQRVGALGAQLLEAEREYVRAKTALVDARNAEGPAVAAWTQLRERASHAGILGDAYTDSARAKTDGKSAEALAQIAGNQRALLRDRLKSARRGLEVLQALEERALGESPRWSDYIEDWATVRDWLRERVPPQVSEAEDPVRVLGDLARHLASLREQLSAREADLRVSSGSIANHLNSAIRTARSLVDRLQEGLEEIRFGSIQRIRVSAENIRPMARILDVLRSDAVQTTLFDSAPTLEQALERIYTREAGGHIAGHRLLDYREYIELRVSVKRENEPEWSEANAARMSTGEAIGVGAALMMVVLDAWEKREMLGRGKARNASLRFLFLDEASRLSVDVLHTLFELCERLQLQMLVAAPEVPLSEGNITWHLERVNGEVQVTGRKVEA